MFGYTLRRLLWMIPVLFTVGLVTFIVMRAAPGSPFDRDPNRRQMAANTQRILEEKFGLNKPAWRQFTSYMFGDMANVTIPKTKTEPKRTERRFVCGAICGNFGPTYVSKGAKTVQETLFQSESKGKPSRFYYSARLGLQALLFAVVVGIPLGTIAALKQNTIIDYLSLFVSTLFVSVPSLIVAIFLLIIFGRMLGWISIIPRWGNSFTPWILPTFALGLGAMAGITRYTRASVLEVMRQDYVRTARAKGLSESVVILRHILRNSLIPVVTIIFPILAGLLTGSFFTETIFQVPGMGREFVASIGRRDYSMIMGTGLFFAFLIAMANLLVDLAYGVLDPRIKVGK